jgi:hypothetical protein
MSLQITLLKSSTLFREVNNAAVPDVNFLDESRVGWLVSHSFFSRVATLGSHLAGVLIAVSETAGAEGKTVCKFMKYAARAERKESVHGLHGKGG